jgi:hypothetical protein
MVTIRTFVASYLNNIMEEGIEIDFYTKKFIITSNGKISEWVPPTQPLPPSKQVTGYWKEVKKGDK